MFEPRRRTRARRRGAGPAGRRLCGPRFSPPWEFWAWWCWSIGSSSPTPACPSATGERRWPDWGPTCRFGTTGGEHRFVRGKSARDVISALGWVHANDRMFQMELGRRAVAGRLAEIFGRRALDFDMRRSRRCGCASSPKGRRRARVARRVNSLDAYASGVNAWLAARGNDLPPELRLLAVRPSLGRRPTRSVSSS